MGGTAHHTYSHTLALHCTQACSRPRESGEGLLMCGYVHTPYIHHTYTIHTSYVHHTHTIHKPYIHHTYTIHTLYTHHTYTIHTPYIHHIYTIHTPYIRHTVTGSHVSCITPVLLTRMLRLIQGGTSAVIISRGLKPLNLSSYNDVVSFILI